MKISLMLPTICLQVSEAIQIAVLLLIKKYMFAKLIKATDKVEKMFVLGRSHYDKITTITRDKKVVQKFANRKSFKTVWFLGKKKQQLFPWQITQRSIMTASLFW